MGTAYEAAQNAGHECALFFVSSAELAEPLLDLSHDFVDLEWPQKGRFFFQLCTPCHQDRVHSRFLVIAFIGNLLDGHFPFSKTHRLLLLEFGIARFVGGSGLRSCRSSGTSVGGSSGPMSPNDSCDYEIHAGYGGPKLALFARTWQPPPNVFRRPRSARRIQLRSLKCSRPTDGTS